MKFIKSEWLGRWDNFENCFDSENPHIQKAWACAEDFVRQHAAGMPMFAHGAKAFWQSACNTVNDENPTPLGGWEILPGQTEQGFTLRWLDRRGDCICQADYVLDMTLEKGLEGAPNFLFRAVSGQPGPFAWLLSMAPMPERAARNTGGFLSHLHFQFAGQKQQLLQDGALTKPFWYATMCDGSGTVLEQCNIILALHRLPTWDTL